MSEQTAKQAYKARMKQIEKRMQAIRKELDRHQQEFKHDERNWSFAGDLGHVEELIHQAEAFLKNEDIDD